MADMKEPVPVFDALHVPPAAFEQGGVEVLRAVVVDGALHVRCAAHSTTRKPGAC